MWTHHIFPNGGDFKYPSQSFVSQVWVSAFCSHCIELGWGAGGIFEAETLPTLLLLPLFTGTAPCSVLQ